MSSDHVPPEGATDAVSQALGALQSPDTLLRESLTKCRAQLAQRREIRDRENVAIRALVEQETVLARLVHVLDKAIEKAQSQHPASRSK